MSPSDPSLLSSSSSTPLLPYSSLPPVQSTSPPPLCRPLLFHLLLPPSPRVTWTSDTALALPCCPISRAPRSPEPSPAATSSPPRSVPVSTSLRSLLCPAVPVESTRLICTSFSPCRAHSSPITTAATLLHSGEPLDAVGSRRRPPIVSTNPLSSFPSPAQAHQPLNTIGFQPEHPCQ
jgi:hypothetical protein